MNKPMSAKMTAALITVSLALVTAENGELTETELEALNGVGLPQLNALVGRGILARRQAEDLNWMYSVV